MEYPFGNPDLQYTSWTFSWGLLYVSRLCLHNRVYSFHLHTSTLSVGDMLVCLVTRHTGICWHCSYTCLQIYALSSGFVQGIRYRCAWHIECKLGFEVFVFKQLELDCILHSKLTLNVFYTYVTNSPSNCTFLTGCGLLVGLALDTW